MCEAAVVCGKNFGDKSMSRLVLLPDVLSNKHIVIVVVIAIIVVIVTIVMVMTSAGWLDAIQLMAGTVCPR